MKEQAAREADRSHAGAAAPAQMPEEIEGRSLTGAVRMCFAIAGVVACLLAVNQLLNLHLFIGVVFIDNRYLYILAATLFPLIFIVFPIRKTDATSTPWYDWLLALIAFAALIWFAFAADRILSEGWEYGAPLTAKILSGILWLLILEALRRTSGLPMMLIVAVVSLYPVVAEWIPNPLKGNPQEFGDTLAYHIASAESAFGIPMRAFAEIVVGFIVFGVGAQLHRRRTLLQRPRVCAWSAACAAARRKSGSSPARLQGSISGSVISNVISSGVVTIPAMKRTGFRADYAGAVEAVASTGAVLMPPVMGSTAFVMASFLGKSYGEIALAATVPALLFYFALVVQVDAYSAQLRPERHARQRTAAARAVMSEGWFYIPVFALLIVPAGVPARRGDGAVLRDRAAHCDQPDPARAPHELVAASSISPPRSAAASPSWPRSCWRSALSSARCR